MLSNESSSASVVEPGSVVFEGRFGIKLSSRELKPVPIGRTAFRCDSSEGRVVDMVNDGAVYVRDVVNTSEMIGA